MLEAINAKLKADFRDNDFIGSSSVLAVLEPPLDNP